MRFCREFLGRLLVATAFCVVAAGCGSKNPPTATVSGKVLYQGQPLQSGSVLFVPDAGAAARGMIQSDGTFRLSTYKPDDGAIIGKHRAEVRCAAQASPAAAPGEGVVEEFRVGKSLIPRKYTNYVTSGLTFEVGPAGNEYVIELKK